MNTRTTLLTVTAVIASTSPVLLQAAAKPIGFDNCVKAFVATLTPKDADAPKVRSATFIDNASFDVSSSDLILKAHDPLNNKEVAAVVCSVNARGEVLGLQPATSLSML